MKRFHSVMSGLAVRYNLGTLERRVLRDVFLLITTNKQSQTEVQVNENAGRSIQRRAVRKRYTTLRFHNIGEIGTQIFKK